MDNNKDNKFANILVELANTNSSNLETSKEYLKSQDIDTDKFVKNGLKAIKKFQAQQKIQKANKRAALLEKAQKLLNELKDSVDSQNLKQTAMRLLGNDNLELQGFFSNVEDLDNEDALNLINNTKLLEIIEHLEKSQEKNNARD
jgi:hypothetical protein